MSKPDIAEERKAHIVNATISCIAQYGYNSFSMQDVADKAEVSKGIIHYYFFNKEDLMMAVLRKVAGDIEKLIENVHKSEADPRQAVKRLIEICFALVRKNRIYYCISIDFWTQINHKENVRTAVAHHYEQLRKAAAHLIQQGIDAHLFRPGDSLQYASFILALIDGVSLQWLFDENAFQFDSMLELITGVVLNQLAVSNPHESPNT